MDTYRDQPQSLTSSGDRDTNLSSSPSSDDETKAILDVISSPSSDYLVRSYVGEGCFGRVAKCLKTATNETVAVKVMKHKDFTLQAENEVEILKKLRAFDPDRYNFVKFYDSFVDSGNICLEFEYLDVSLWHYLEKKPAYTLTVKEIRPVLYQMGITLQLLKNQGLAHSDLKPDNIMLVDHINQPMRIKMIDFGLACYFTETKCGTYMQPRHYRAPEVILGSPFTAAIDMWSLGCIAAELYLGHVLYPGTCEYDMIRQILQTQGQFPFRTLNAGLKTRTFFKRWKKGRRWRLKSLFECGYSSFSDTQYKSLDDLKKVRPAHHLTEEDTAAEMKDRDSFVELLKRMLHLDIDKRITPSELLEDPFITMTDIAQSFPDSFYVKSGCEMMKVCQDSKVQQDQQLCLNQQPSTSTASPVQQDNSSHVTPAWQSPVEHPVILTIASSVSSSLSIDEPQKSSQQPETGFTFSRKRTQLDTDSPMHFDGAPSPHRGGLRRGLRQTKTTTDDPTSLAEQATVQKRKRDILEEDGSRSPDDQSEHRKRKRRRADSPENTEDASVNASPDTDQTKPNRKRTWDTFIAAHSRHREPDNPPVRKKRRLTYDLEEAEIKPTGERTWDAFIAAHSRHWEQDNNSPVRKKRRLTCDLEEALPSEADIKPQRKRTWETYKASHTGLKKFTSDSPKKKKIKMNQEEEETHRNPLNKSPEAVPKKRSRKRNIKEETSTEKSPPMTRSMRKKKAPDKDWET
ncbi:homeodomain-interacting protein kinase 2-like isoform X2 [Notolabrus celidotus]|uniref:homeodomain-interacting protein kinase 2-like isoform X2 n=1 Tax=Notolabrus celidotus TaxID=1203425 RepID=UPI00148F57FE|nr:homeodomain-interacting protein kinase 2-like isoform X2 [Notolabrus celidotus]